MFAKSQKGSSFRILARQIAVKAALLLFFAWSIPAVFPAAAVAAEPEIMPAPQKWLIVQTRDLSGEAPTGLNAAVTNALSTELSAIEGWTVWLNDSGSPQVQKALKGGLLNESEATYAPDLSSARRLGLAWGADTVLIGLLVRQDDSVVLLLNAIGVLGRETAGPGKALDIPSTQVELQPESSPQSIAESLTEGVGEKLRTLLQENPALSRGNDQAAQEWEAEGDVLMQEGRFQGARAAFAAAIAIDAERTGAQRRLAQAMLALGQTDEARKLLEKTFGTAPKDIEASIVLGEVYLALGNPGRAAWHYRRASLAAPDDLRALRGMARADLARGNIAPALRQLAGLVEREPEDVALRCDYGHALLKADLPTKARAEFDRCLALDPENIEARQYMAEIFFAERKIPEAIEQLRLMTDISGNFAGYPTGDYTNLMRLLLREFNAVFEEANVDLGDYFADALTQGDLWQVADDLHFRSDNLARVLERISPPDELDKSHRFYVLAANLLNHSDFELLRYARKEGGDYIRRYQLFRSAAREAAIEASTLARESPGSSALAPTSASR